MNLNNHQLNYSNDTELVDNLAKIYQHYQIIGNFNTNVFNTFLLRFVLTNPGRGLMDHIITNIKLN